MKKWSLPVINVEKFTANEYVAACSWSGGNLNITCGYDSEEGANFVNPTHSYSDNPNQITISGANWSQFSSRGTWFSSDGTYVQTGGANAVPDDYHGDYVYYCYVITKNNKKWLIWDIYVWRRNDYVMTTDKHRTGYGNSGNPES